MDNLDDVPDKDQQLKLVKQYGLDSYLDRDIKKFWQKFVRLEELLTLPAGNDHFEEAYGLFYHIFDVVPIMYHRLSDVPIFRAARNKIDEVFSTQTRISYNKNLEQIGPGKFNVWNQSMFYGCLPYRPKNNEEYPVPRLVAALECCKDLYRDDRKLIVQDITIGRWEIKEPFDAINLSFDPAHLEKNPELQSANENFKNGILSAYSKDGAEFITKIYEYFSCLCRIGSDEKSYYILTALFVAIQVYYKENFGRDIAALISPSAASEGHGLNIVIKPDTVDKCLWLQSVVMDRYFLVFPELTNYATYAVSEIATNHNRESEFNFEFKRYLPIAERYKQKFASPEYGYLRGT